MSQWQKMRAYATVVPLLGIVGTWLFYFIDRHWYHRLLLGSVIQGSAIEEKYRKTIPELALTNAIGKESPISVASWPTRFLVWICVNDERSRSSGRIHSTGKIELFYKPMIYIFLTLSIVLAISGGMTFNGKSLLEVVGLRVAPEAQLQFPELRLDTRSPGIYNLEIRVAPSSASEKTK
jgi:hypothetical protein